MLSDYQLRTLGEITFKHVKLFFENPENQRRFEEWRRRREGWEEENADGVNGAKDKDQ